jgi:hypothetical protein
VSNFRLFWWHFTINAQKMDSLFEHCFKAYTDCNFKYTGNSCTLNPNLPPT